MIGAVSLADISPEFLNRELIRAIRRASTGSDNHKCLIANLADVIGARIAGIGYVGAVDRIAKSIVDLYLESHNDRSIAGI